VSNSPEELSLESIDRHNILHPFTDLKRFAAGKAMGPRIMTAGRGIRVRDSSGHESIDAFAGLYCVNVGYGRQEIADAIHKQASKLAYYHTYAAHSNEPSIRLSEQILSLAPPGMRRVFFGLSGSDANETQIKIAWYYNNVLGRPQKKKIISRHRGYHGATIMSGSLTGLSFYHRAFDLPVPLVLHTTVPHAYWEQSDPSLGARDFSRRCAADLERLIQAEGPETIAAFIAEPALGTGGLIPPPEGYWEEIQPVLQRHEILLIADEVVCGFGRTGANFGSTLYAIKPDLITIAKGLTSAYLPLSGVIVSEQIERVLEAGSDRFGVFSHGYTYTAHPLCAAAGVANLEIIERENLVENARVTGAYLQTCLREGFEALRYVAEVRGVGLMAAIEFARDPAARERFPAEAQVGAKLSAACLANGVICRAMPHGDILGLAPPLILTRADVDEIVGRILEAVKRTLEQL
jgi:L-2,4-diaminobutyrate transaminase